MPIPFSRSMRSLEADSYRVSSGTVAIVVILLAAWLAWFAAARISLYEVSQRARVEVMAATHSVEAEVSGSIIKNNVELGRQVHRGDVLLELEARSEALEIAEEQSSRRGSVAELERLEQQITSLEEAIERLRAAGRLQIAEVEAGLRAAQSSYEYARVEHQRVAELNAEDLKSDADLDKALADLKRAEANLDAAKLMVSRKKEEVQVDLGDRSAQLESLRRDASQLEARISGSERAEERLGVQLGKRQIRAPVDGTLGEIAEDLQVGNFVSAGDKLCAIVPSGDGHIVVAEFAPSEALGRIRPGQKARLRLDSYPWTQYGTVGATVQQVASEVRNGSVRVELAIDSDVPDGIHLEHGLPGALEVEVDRTSPMILVLRSVGKLVEGA